VGYDIHSDLKGGGEGPSLLAIFKTGLGTVLILAGASLGFYVAFTAFGLIAGEKPPQLVAHFAGDQVKGAVELPDNKGPMKFEVSPNVLQMGLYFLSFLLLTIPSAIATGIIRAGVGLMDSESITIMKQLLEKLRRP